MAPLSCCDLTSLDETVQLTYFPLSRTGLVEPNTSSYDDHGPRTAKASWDSASTSYWDWPSVDNVQHDTMIDLFSGSYIEKSLESTAAKFNKDIEEEENCAVETQSTEPIRGPIGTYYWDWSADSGSLKQSEL